MQAPLSSTKGEKMKSYRYTIFVVAVFFALLLSAMNAAPALADDSLPPAEETPSAEAPPAEEMTGETEPAAQEGEALPPAEEVDPVSAESSILEELPEDTQLIVVGEDGEALPLASQEAAEVLAAADPQWCPVGVVPGSAACSGIKDSFNGADPNTDLIAWLLANQPNKAGVIWVQAGYVGTVGIEGGAIVLDGNDYTSMDNYALTVNGGWTGTGMVMNPATPSTFNVPFAIVNWTGAVTLNNIVVTGASGAGTYALDVATKGNITLTNVDVQNNTTESGGALLNNTSGTGNVVVNDSTFNGNSGSNGWGLVVYSNGLVTGKNLSALGNAMSGAYINNSSAATPKPVTLNGFNNFSLNGGNGLEIYSKGAVTLSNITAIYNTGGSGAYLDNNYGVASNVIVKGVNNFSSNGWDGLRVWSAGAITLSNITANDNGTDPNRPAATWWYEDSYYMWDPILEEFVEVFYDVYYNNAFGKGVFLSNYWATTSKPVTFTGTNTFNGNAGNGLYVDSFGAVKISNVTANNNICDPTKDLTNSNCAGVFIEGMSIAQTGYGIFVNNDGSGFLAYAWQGAVSLTNLYAEYNSQYGVDTYSSCWPNPCSFNLSITGTNVFNNNGHNGLYAWAKGVVSLSNLTAIGNGGDGVYVSNWSAPSPKAVIISGTNIFNGNGWDGLSVRSMGAITTYNVTAMYNGGEGVFLDNCDWDWNDGCMGVGYSPQPITMNGINNASENWGDGVSLTSFGAIRFSNLTANSNGNLGAYIVNSSGNAIVGVTQTGYATFLGNTGLSGFNIFSRGAVMLANVTANGNNTYGGAITNDYDPLKPANVTLSGTNIFNDNGRGGLRIYTFGAVVLNNVTANENGWGGSWVWDEDLQDYVWEEFGTNHGVSIYGAGGSLSRPVTLNGVNTFNGNNGFGLLIESLGAIKVSKVTANGNTYSGANLDNKFDLFNAPITLLGYGVFNDNATGLVAHSNGAITTSNVTANSNFYVGVVLSNYSLTAVPVTVTMLGVNTFNGTTNGDGLVVWSDGQITLNNITANYNNGYGADLDNMTNSKPGAPRNILLNGTNNFIGNSWNGLFFNASGSVFLTRVTAALNNDGIADAFLSYGIWGTAGGNITLTCGALFLNENSGYFLSSGGIVTLKGVFSYGNGTPDSAIGTSVLITRTCPLP
jgi:hypothetical protein